MTQTNIKNKTFVDLYSGTEDFLLPHTVRKKSVNLFDKIKLPDNKTENWRKFKSEPIFEHHYSLGKKLNVDTKDLDSLSFFEPSGNYVILVNGFFYSGNVKKPDLNNNVFIGSLKDAQKTHPEIISDRLHVQNAKTENYFSVLNDAYAKDGAFVYVPENVILDEPIYIMHFIQSDNGNIFSQNRNLIIAGKNTAFKIIHTYHSLSSDFSFNNSITDIFADENAQLEYYLFEGEGNTAAHINHININSEKGSSFKSNIVTFCGSAVRNNFYAEFKNEHAAVDLQGIYMPDKEQTVDNFIEINHAKPNCRSNQVFKGIIDNKAVAVFTGKVFVARDAQKTDSAQSNQNLLLTDYARIHSRPQLEIYADDVICSHGSTTGQLDKEALFYMKTRGVPEKRAKTMLMKAFLRDVTDKINADRYREYVNFLISKRLKGQSPESLCAVKVCPSC
ncbi:MAG: Fe-S cluster assembly protein SufD [Chlorobi bacterium]|nr:Fe-S cluster assembly protein SufD [Chlorobiota bacterium]